MFLQKFKNNPQPLLIEWLRVFILISMTRKERIIERNKSIRIEFKKMVKDNPKWRIDSVVEEIAKKRFLSSRTIEAIVSGEGIYK